MEYWIAMNKKELQISLLLLGKTDFPGLLKLQADFFPEEKDLREMERKKFFEKKDDGMIWNSFVKTLLWCSVNAQSELRIDQGNQTMCRLYFYDETMVLMVRDFEKDLYVFYYVPLLPKAIGGLAKALENLENAMSPSTGGEPQTIQIPTEIPTNVKSMADILEYAVPELGNSGFEPLSADGWCLGEHTFETVLIKFQKGFFSSGRDEKEFRLESVGFFDFIQQISHWIVRTHGRSIAEKEKHNG